MKQLPIVINDGPLQHPKGNESQKSQNKSIQSPPLS